VVDGLSIHGEVPVAAGQVIVDRARWAMVVSISISGGCPRYR
jgi:hypothetical protein